MSLSHHDYTDNIPCSDVKGTPKDSMCIYERTHSYFLLVVTDNCGDTGSECRYTTCKWQLSARSFVHAVFSSAVRFMMIHVYVLFYNVSNHFYNTHNSQLLSALTSAGLKNTECCILAVVKVRSLGSYCTPHKFYIIFMIVESHISMVRARCRVKVALRHTVHAYVTSGKMM